MSGSIFPSSPLRLAMTESAIAWGKLSACEYGAIPALDDIVNLVFMCRNVPFGELLLLAGSFGNGEAGLLQCYAPFMDIGIGANDGLKGFQQFWRGCD